MSLGELWNSKPELFGSSSPVFPLLTKILDASDNLSVQVHPDDGYADKNENGELGKTECWYILDAEPDATIIYGHEASSKQELEYMIQSGEWEKLLRKIPVKQGDFSMYPAAHYMLWGKELSYWRPNKVQTRLIEYMIMVAEIIMGICVNFI